MGIFRKKEPAIPEGQGVGPDFTAPDPLISGPYISAGGGYAPSHEAIEAQWQQYNHHNSPPPGDPDSWGKYHNSQTESYNEERSVSIPESVQVVEKSREDDPRWNPVIPSRRITAPSTYRFIRAFDTWAARHLTGGHFSMADHERTYNIGGMTPARERGRRNTYRLTPEPWDENIVDRVVQSAPVNGTYISTEDTGSGTRSWRL